MIVVAVVFALLALVSVLTLPGITGNVVSHESIEIQERYQCEDGDGKLDVEDESIFVKSSVIKSPNTGTPPTYYWDDCVGKRKIKEYLCTNKGVETRRYQCANGCLDGACVK